MARRLEERDGVRVELVSVIEPVPIYDTGFMVALPETELFEARKATVEEEIHRQLEEVTGSRTPWPIHVEPGVPTSRIVAMAEDLGAELIVIGLGRHGSLDRLFGRETALQVIRLAHIPVLAVPADIGTLPNSALLAVDFSTFSVRAAEAATAVLKSPATLHMVHAISGLEFVPTADGDWHPEHIRQLENRLRDFCEDLDLPEGWTRMTQVLEGEPSHEILAYAEEKDVDMIVAGSHGHSFVGRLLMGSVSTRLVRGTKGPILIIPPSDVPEEVSASSSRASGAHPWEQLLRSFTERNAGCRTELEMDHPGIGAQHSGKNFPLWGVVYDRRSDRLQIMLGEQGSVENHLTHSIPSPREVELLQDEDGRDSALHVVLDEGSVILRLLRG
jgi:nucleotide-binding universal stress UspA family protein